MWLYFTWNISAYNDVDTISSELIQIRTNFEQYVTADQNNEKEKQFITQCDKLLDTLSFCPDTSTQFSTCSASICDTMNVFLNSMKEKRTLTEKNKDFFWTQYKGFRDLCKPVAEIQSDLICHICFASEINLTFNCGHVFCESCSRRCTSCPECREPITSRLKLYF